MNELDIMIVFLLTPLCIIFVLIPPFNHTDVRVVLGIVFLVFLPGYSVTIALFPKTSTLDKSERIVLSIGLSIIIAPILGVLLNYTSIGINTNSILVILSTFIISLSLIAWYRKMKLPIEDRLRIRLDGLFNFKSDHHIIDKVVWIILMLTIIGSVTTLIYVISTPKTGERFTEFYLLNSNETASDYPTELKLGEPGNLIVGIVNHEFENTTYRIEVWFNDSQIYDARVFLIDTELWENTFTFLATKKGENQKLEFILYKNKEKKTYRKIHLWVNIN